MNLMVMDYKAFILLSTLLILCLLFCQSVTAFEAKDLVYTRIVSDIDDEITVFLYVSEGLNLLSLPVDNIKNNKLSDIFSNVRQTWVYNENKTDYKDLKSNKKLKAGQGYFINFSRARTFILKGNEIKIRAYNLESGWSLIGSCTYPAKASSCDGEIIVIFKFTSAAYKSLEDYDLIEPGQGYWVYFMPYNDRKGTVILKTND